MLQKRKILNIQYSIISHNKNILTKQYIENIFIILIKIFAKNALLISYK